MSTERWRQPGACQSKVFGSHVDSRNSIRFQLSAAFRLLKLKRSTLPGEASMQSDKQILRHSVAPLWPVCGRGSGESIDEAVNINLIKLLQIISESFSFSSHSRHEFVTLTMAGTFWDLERAGIPPPPPHSAAVSDCEVKHSLILMHIAEGDRNRSFVINGTSELKKSCKNEEKLLQPAPHSFGIERHFYCLWSNRRKHLRLKVVIREIAFELFACKWNCSTKVSFSIFVHMWRAVGANKTRINCLCKSCFACNSRASNKIFSNNACWSRTSEQTAATAEWDGRIETSDLMQRRLGTN